MDTIVSQSIPYLFLHNISDYISTLFAFFPYIFPVGTPFCICLQLLVFMLAIRGTFPDIWIHTNQTHNGLAQSDTECSLVADVKYIKCPVGVTCWTLRLHVLPSCSIVSLSA